MSGTEKSFDYFISETLICNPRQLAAEIAIFFAKQHKKVAIIMKGPKISVDQRSISETIENFKTLTPDEYRLIRFMYCKELHVVQKILLEMDSSVFVPNVVIIQSLHQWYTGRTMLIEIPTIYAAVCSAAIDLSKSLAKVTNQECFSFITADTADFPKSFLLTELLYEDVVAANPDHMQEVFERHKKLDN